MKRTMLMAAAIWALGSVTAYAQNSASGDGEALPPDTSGSTTETPAPPAEPVPDTWTPGTHTAPTAPEPTPVVPEAMAPAPVEPVPVPAPMTVRPKIYHVGAGVLLGGGF